MRKKRQIVGKMVIPEKPTANLTPTMRAELNATPEVFENVSFQSSSTSSVKIGKSESVMKELPKMASRLVEARSDARIRDITVTSDDVRTFDTDVVGTYSQSSGTISYDSIRSMNDASLEQAKVESKCIRNTELGLQNVAQEQLHQDGEQPEVRVVSDAELNRRITGQETPFNGHEALPPATIWGQYETILVKTCINEVVENFFASPRDDVQLMMRLSRREMFPKLHIELTPLHDDQQIVRPQALPPILNVGSSRHRRFDDLLRIDVDHYLPQKDVSIPSMEEKSASMCYTAYSDVATARSPNHNYLTTAYSYLIAFVKSVVPRRSRSSTATGEHTEH